MQCRLAPRARKSGTVLLVLLRECAKARFHPGKAKAPVPRQGVVRAGTAKGGIEIKRERPPQGPERDLHANVNLSDPQDEHAGGAAAAPCYLPRRSAGT